MNKNDVIWFTLMKAAVNEKETIHYLYSNVENVILKVNIEGKNIIPLCRQYNNFESDLTKQILLRYINNDKNLFELSNFSENEKSTFINNFVNSIEDINLKTLILSKINCTNIYEGGKIISKIDFPLSMYFTQKFNSFLNEKYINSYFPLGISENTEVV